MNTSTNIAAALLALLLCMGPASAADLKVMKTGLGSGTVSASMPGISCGIDCDEPFAATASVTLTVTPAAGSIFTGWSGDCSGTAPCTLSMGANRAVRAAFSLASAVPPLTDFTPVGIRAYLTANPAVNSPARFLAALPADYKQNWILASRSESLQTGTAIYPRLLLPNVDARSVFSVGAAAHNSYPGAHPNAIEHMQWDDGEKNFRFHEIIVDAIPAMGGLPARSRGVADDDDKCSKCHSTRNVLNRTASPGTTGIPPGTVKAKNKPNWDAYDSWGGMLPFNRDRIYQGSLEAAAFRQLFNLWNWRNSDANDAVRQLLEQLELQPPHVSASSPHRIVRNANDATDAGHIVFGFDALPPLPTTSASTGHSFGGAAVPPSPVNQGGRYVTLRHSNPMPPPSNDTYANPGSDEGRGVQLFDLLGGLDGNLNPQRIADELTSHRFATGSVPIDVRPIALAITKRCLRVDTATNTIASGAGLPALAIDASFFDTRNGMRINELTADTRARAESLPRRKAEIQRFNLDRSGDPYLFAAENGLIPRYGAATPEGTNTAIPRIRQEVFRRPVDLGIAASAVAGNVYVDRELYPTNTGMVALYRYFLEPLGVSVDKWSMGVRGRSRTYTFADVFGSYLDVLQPRLEASLSSEPVPGLAPPYSCADLIGAVNTTLMSLPAAVAVPTYTDVQRIFNKGCIECHGGLGYPPYGAGYLDLSEDEGATMGSRLARPYAAAAMLTTGDPLTSYLYQRITNASEDCPSGMMPCGGPPLSKVDVETIRRWIVGGRSSTVGDPHVKTVDGVSYDFQSAGEFVLLRDEGIEVQARQTAVATESPLAPDAHTGLSSCVSVNTAIAVRVGPHRISYQPGAPRDGDRPGLQLRIDGKPANIDGREFHLASGGRIVRTEAVGGIQIEGPGGTVVSITPGWWDHYRLWYLNVDAKHVRATQGVMGPIARGDWLPALPDGRSLGPRPADLHRRYVDLYGTFADAWRVTDTSTLFDYSPGTSTRDFSVANWPAESPQSCPLPRGPGGPATTPPKPLPREQAAQHCRAIAAADRRAHCEHDVAVTGEPGFAATYLAAERVEGNALPAVPRLDLPADATDLAGPVSFGWAGVSDPDGDTVTYKHCVWLAGKPLSFKDCDSASVQVTTSRGGLWYVVLAVLVVGLVLVAVLSLRAKRRAHGPLWLLALLIVAALLLLALYFHLGRTAAASASRTVIGLQTGQAYLWKVIAEDGKGGSTDSETRRFTTR